MQGDRKYRLAEVRKAAAKFGGTVDPRLLRTGTVGVLAPPGKLWSCTGDIHELIVYFGDPDDLAVLDSTAFGQWIDDAVTDVLERIAYGVCDCDTPECDWCRPPVD